MMPRPAPAGQGQRQDRRAREPRSSRARRTVAEANRGRGNAARALRCIRLLGETPGVGPNANIAKGIGFEVSDVENGSAPSPPIVVRILSPGACPARHEIDAKTDESTRSERLFNCVSRSSPLRGIGSSRTLGDARSASCRMLQKKPHALGRRSQFHCDGQPTKSISSRAEWE
jgi:hypothetical protein